MNERETLNGDKQKNGRKNGNNGRERERRKTNGERGQISCLLTINEEVVCHGSSRVPRYEFNFIMT